MNDKESLIYEDDHAFVHRSSPRPILKRVPRPTTLGDFLPKTFEPLDKERWTTFTVKKPSPKRQHFQDDEVLDHDAAHSKKTKAAPAPTVPSQAEGEEWRLWGAIKSGLTYVSSFFFTPPQ